jgi:hypothetical protein
MMHMRIAVAAGLALGLFACGAPEPAHVPPEDGATVAGALAPASAASPRTDFLPSERIYYDLTRFEWYAHGEPLRAADLSYQPAGLPLAAPLAEMERAGEYRGVEYYRRSGSDDRLYVPVFEGYWLAFRAVSGPPVPAD